MQEHPLLIIDGHGFVFRAYHMLPPLTSPKGEPVGAVYGFMSMLIKVLNDFKPKRMVVVFDAGGKNFRHQIYDQYKAHRPAVAEDLIAQLSLVRDVATNLNLPILEKQVFEADDIIATLATKASNNKENTVIISSDKDLLQLVDDHTNMFDPMKNKYILDNDIIDKFGVSANKLHEVLALIGDKSDNIPGVPGIGPKTAAELIKQFESVNNLLNSIDQIKSPRLQELLKISADAARLSWQLVELDRNVDINFNNDSFALLPPDPEKLMQFISSYGFKSLHKRIENLFHFKMDEQTITVEDKEKENNIEIITNKEKLKEILVAAKDLGRLIISVLDTKDKQLSVFLAIKQKGYVINITEEKQNLDLFNFSVQKTLNWFLSPLDIACRDRAIKKITFNLKKLLKFFHHYEVETEDFAAFEDIELMEYTVSAGLPQNNYSTISTEGINKTARLLIDSFTNYDQLMTKISEHHAISLYKDIDLPLCFVIDRMENAGVKVDLQYLNKLSREFAVLIQDLEREIYQIASVEFNLASPKQLGEVLFEKMQLPGGKLSPKTKSYATGAEILEKLSELGYKIAELLLNWRQLTKLKNTYTDTLPSHINKSTSRIHSTFLQNATSTARLSSKDPNLQNIPIRSEEGNKIRAAFIAEKGYQLISADYSQIELRILSHIANVKVLKEAFINGEDIHRKTAASIFKIPITQLTIEHRRKAKAINFGIIYGISAFGLAKQLNILPNEAADYIGKYFAEYPEIKEYMENTKSYAKEYGYVKNLFNRKCFVPTINDKNGAIRQFAQRAAINAPIQSSNADIIKIAMINLDRKIRQLNLKAKLILQIHDELLFEVSASEVENILPIIKSTMENSSLLSVPLIVDVRAGNNWMEIH